MPRAISRIDRASAVPPWRPSVRSVVALPVSIIVTVPSTPISSTEIATITSTKVKPCWEPIRERAIATQSAVARMPE